MPEYFSHDYGARKDPKMILLQQKMGHEGHGIYWGLIETLYEQNGYIMRSHCDGIAFDLHTSIDKINSVINNFDLFKFDIDKIWSDSVLKRIKIRHEKSEKAANSAKFRWNNANALRTHCDGNAKKEIKEKEIKEIKEEIHLEKTWRDDFEIYRNIVETAFVDLKADKDTINRLSEAYLGVDIEASLKRAVLTYWGTSAGWENKKNKKNKNINMKQTLINAINISKVYFPRSKNVPKKRIGTGAGWDDIGNNTTKTRGAVAKPGEYQEGDCTLDGMRDTF